MTTAKIQRIAIALLAILAPAVLLLAARGAFSLGVSDGLEAAVGDMFSTFDQVVHAVIGSLVGLFVLGLAWLLRETRTGRVMALVVALIWLAWLVGDVIGNVTGVSCHCIL